MSQAGKKKSETVISLSRMFSNEMFNAKAQRSKGAKSLHEFNELTRISTHQRGTEEDLDRKMEKNQCLLTELEFQVTNIPVPFFCL